MHPGQAFWDSTVPPHSFIQTLPDPLQIKPSGLLPQQLRVYEDFSMCSFIANVISIYIFIKVTMAKDAPLSVAPALLFLMFETNTYNRRDTHPHLILKAYFMLMGLGKVL